VLPGDLGEFAQGAEFGELGLDVGDGDAARAQVAQLKETSYAFMISDVRRCRRSLRWWPGITWP
jgi:hypothetical protein